MSNRPSSQTSSPSLVISLKRKLANPKTANSTTLNTRSKRWGMKRLTSTRMGAIIKLVSDLLLVLIIMEVLGTVIHYLKAHATSLRPFLFIGIVSATRGILSIGARLSVEKVTLPSPEFTSAMVELGVNAAVILALGITLKLLGKLIEQ